MASPHEYVFHPTKGGREGVYFVLGLNAILIALLLVLVVHRVVEPISTGPRTAIVFALELVEILSPLVIFHFLLRKFDKTYWKTPRLGRAVFWMAGTEAPPDVSGSYVTTMDCFEPDTASGGARNGYNADITIKQTWRTMAVILRFRDYPIRADARSESEMAVLRVEVDDTVSLGFEYCHKDIVERPGKGVFETQIHGFTNLHFRREENRWNALGTYFDADAGSGKMTLKPGP